MIAAISSEVATGRRMKSRDGLIRSNRHSGAPPFGRRPVLRRGGLLSSCRRLRRASRRSAGLTGLGELYLGAFFEAVGAVGDDELAGFQPLRHRDELAVV